MAEPAPEIFSRGRAAFLISFAFFTWIYRLVLFLGIAVLVYHFFIKVVGIVLFGVELAWFVVRPVWVELKEWGKIRDKVKTGQRTPYSFAAAFRRSASRVETAYRFMPSARLIR